MVATTKGFAKPKAELYQTYTADLKKTFATDGSEWLVGTATIKIPKRLSDPNKEETKSEVWDCFAEAIAYHLLFLPESANRKVNTVFVFRPTKANPFPEPTTRISYLPWQEKYSQSAEKPTEWEERGRSLKVVEAAAKTCQIDIEWLDNPKPV